MPLPRLPKKPLSSAQNTAKRIVHGSVKSGVREAIAAYRANRTERSLAGAERSAAKVRSDYIYNERRKAKRLVNRLELDSTFQTGAQLKATRQLIGALKTEIQKTYAPRKGKRFDPERQLAAVGNLARVTESFRQGAALNRQERQRRVFEHQLRLAGKGNVSTLGRGSVAKGKVKIFLRSTQDIWQGLPNPMRMQAVIDYYGGAELSEIWDTIMEANERAIAALEDEAAEVETTAENEFYYGEQEAQQTRAGSPRYLDYVVSAIYIAL